MLSEGYEGTKTSSGVKEVIASLSAASYMVQIVGSISSGLWVHPEQVMTSETFADCVNNVYIHHHH